MYLTTYLAVAGAFYEFPLLYYRWRWNSPLLKSYENVLFSDCLSLFQTFFMVISYYNLHNLIMHKVAMLRMSLFTLH
jgi:hypothetical protein